MKDYSNLKKKIIDSLPELNNLKGVVQSGSTHYADAYTHTIDAVDYTVEILTEIDKVNPDTIRNDYIVAFNEFLNDYLSWLDESLPNRIALAESESKLSEFKSDSQPKFFTYIENVGYGPEDSRTGKGAVLISVYAGHMNNLASIASSREIKYSMSPYHVYCPHPLEIRTATDPILPDPEFTITATALHDIGKIKKGSDNGVAPCHDRAGFAYAGKISKRFFSSSRRKDIETVVLNHHIMPPSKSVKAFSEKYLNVIKYGYRFSLLPEFYIVRVADILAHVDSFHTIADELFVAILNTIGAAQSEKMLACPLHVFGKYLGRNPQALVPKIREKVLPATFEDGIGNDFVFEYYYLSKLIRNK